MPRPHPPPGIPVPHCVVSDRHRSIWIHVAKNASSTFEREFTRDFYGGRKCRFEDLDEALKARYFTFAILREPVSRLLSAYQEICLRHEAGWADYGPKRFLAMEEGLAKFETFTDELGDRRWDPHVRDQSVLLANVRIDHYASIETLKEDLETLFRLLGMAAVPTRPHARSRAGRREEHAYARHFLTEDDLEASRIAPWFWEKLGLTDRIVPKPLNAEAGFVVHADQVLFPQFDPNLGSYGIHGRNTLLPVRRRLGVLEPVERDRVLFLDRPGRGKFRCVGNRDELLGRLRELLRGSRYRLEVFHSEGNQDADMEIFRRAKIILGPHGGSFANIVFAQPGTHVIEFLPIYRLYAEGAEARPTFWGLAQAAGLDYWTSEPRVFDFDAPDMLVDVEDVAGIIRQLIDAS